MRQFVLTVPKRRPIHLPVRKPPVPPRSTLRRRDSLLCKAGVLPLESLLIPSQTGTLGRFSTPPYVASRRQGQARLWIDRHDQQPFQFDIFQIAGSQAVCCPTGQQRDANLRPAGPIHNQHRLARCGYRLQFVTLTFEDACPTILPAGYHSHQNPTYGPLSPGILERQHVQHAIIGS